MPMKKQVGISIPAVGDCSDLVENTVFYKSSIENQPISCYSNHIKKRITNGQSIPVNRPSHCKQLQQFGPVIAALIAF
jgi:hypothetical protein